MTRLTDALLSLGGVAHLHQLRTFGLTDSHIRRAHSRGEIARLRQAVYAHPQADPDVVRAAIVGGRVAGASAARFHGLWTPPNSPFTVEVSHHARPGADAGTRILWHPDSYSLEQALGVSSLAETLRQIVLTEPENFAMAVLDSALRTSGITAVEFESIAARVPQRSRRPFRLADGRAESGTESLVRILLLDAGIVAVPQVRVPLSDLERVDLLIGDRLVIECDSSAHHGSRDQRLRDLRRDASLAAMGFIVLRFDYWQVMHEPESVLAAVEAYVAAELHVTTGR